MVKKLILSLAAMLGLHSSHSEADSSDDPLWSAYHTISAKAKHHGASSLDEFEQAFMLVWELESEINNGGFHQYFYNSSGDHSVATRAVLLKIGAPKTAKILLDAMSLFPDSNPSAKREERQKQLESISPDADLFESHDERFLKYEEDVSGLALKFYENSR